MIKPLLKKRLIPAALAVILLLMTVLRIGYFYQIRAYPGFDRFLLPDDQVYYHETARRIADTDIPQKGPTFIRGPGYLFFLGIVYKLFANGALMARVVQWGLGILTGLIIYLLARRLFTVQTALAAILLYALYLPALCYEGALLMASLITFLLTSGLYCLIRAAQDKSYSMSTISGILFGWAFLCRPNNLIFFLAGMFFLFSDKNDKRLLIRFVLSFGLVYGLLIIRNFSAGAELLTITTQGNRVMMNSHFHEAVGVGWWWQENWNTLLSRNADGLWQFLLFLADDIGSHFTAWIHLQFFKLYAFFFNYEYSQFIDFYALQEILPLLRLPYISLGILSPLVIAGLMLLIVERRKENHLALALYFMAGVFSVACFYILERFRLPLIPLFCIISAYMLCSLPRIFKTSRLTGRISLAALLIVLAVSFNIQSIRKSFSQRFMPSAIFNRGIQYKTDGQYDRAALDFKRIYSSLKPDTDNEVYYLVSMNLAECLQQTEQKEQAVAIWEDLIRRTPDRERPYKMLARHYNRQGEYNRALFLLTKAVQRQPQNRDLQRLLKNIKHSASTASTPKTAETRHDG